MATKTSLICFLMLCMIALAAPASGEPVPIRDGADYDVYAIVVRPDSKIVIGGDFTEVANIPRPGVARLYPDGNLDLGFETRIRGNISLSAREMAVQADGKVLLGSPFSRLERLNADGSFDLDFHPNAYALSIAVQADQKILMGGQYQDVGATKNFVRLNPDGSLDAEFNPETNAPVRSIAIQPDGRIVIGGDFTAIGAVTRNHIARLFADGNLDPDFNPGADATVDHIALGADGKILIEGSFTSTGGATRPGIARLNSDGSVDTDFSPDAPESVFGGNGVTTIALQPDGKVLIGGHFTKVGSETRHCIARLNADGSLDPGFNPDAGSTVHSIAVQPDGKILIGGDFKGIGEVARHRIARLNPDGSLDADFNPDATPLIGVLEYPQNGQIVAGITTVHGWALDGERVDKVEWFVDGVPLGKIPYGGSRKDVEKAYPYYPSAEASGFGLVFNWSLLSPGPHSLKVRLHDIDDDVDEIRDLDAVVNVKAFHGEFVTDVSNDATWTLKSTPVTTGGVTKIYDISFKWDVPSQSLRITDIVEKLAGGGDSAANGIMPDAVAEAAPAGKTDPASSLDSTTLIGVLESPQNGQTVAGITTVHGWALSGKEIVGVGWYLDDIPMGQIPYGGSRMDVKNAFPNHPDAEHPGFGLVFNWFLIPPGEHAIKVSFSYFGGEKSQLDAVVNVKAFHGEFVTDVGNGAIWTFEDIPVTAGGVTKIYDISFKWDVPSQGFRITDIIEK